MLKDIYKTMLDKVNEDIQCTMLTFLNFEGDRKGSIENKILVTRDDIENKTLDIDDESYEKALLSLDTGKVQFIEREKQSIFIEPVIPEPRLIIFGGGHIAKPLSEFASRVGFSITLIDDRPFFANTERFPEADSVICERFENSFNLINLRKSDFVVIITRGHRYDGIIIREILNYELSYVGMIGSKRRVRGMMDELRSEGYSEDKLDSVNSPIGFPIGAITPDEIAISITAELINYKNKGVINKYGKTFSFPELDVEVAESILKDSSMPKALITIISTKGSVPRKAGAKMIAYLDGRTIGSIGGGCSEADVITAARELMETKGFLIEHVDMTGDVAEAEGMVCGGTMEVLVEVF
ncbi:XdhC family protein [Clostridium cylindrosporum]|uniref:XdhC rossmann domain/XdhC and CoxI family n=1 Tax=Clostridium cylindrosporum DSM 605 TaxID=1121307 RepID=A0A0J8G315_CLOCY|nr:XdhC/CoxI family protein [Clostridium cylindrosporum]KMT22091.1 XdhC rossmann domain/XdhC and CoxI family [Clostridium cylindrosporum DSM 605]